MKLDENHNAFIIGVNCTGESRNALIRFMSHLPSKSHNFAFILYPSDDPELETRLIHLLGSHAEWMIQYAQQNDTLKKGNIYLCPPGYQVLVKDSKIILNKDQSPLSVSVDDFLASLAQDLKEYAVGVILSGIGKDGVEGIRQIKEAGGYVLVQEPADAEYADLPSHVIASNAVHRITKASHMMEAIIEYVTAFHTVQQTVEIDKQVPLLNEGHEQINALETGHEASLSPHQEFTTTEPDVTYGNEQSSQNEKELKKAAQAAEEQFKLAPEIERSIIRSLVEDFDDIFLAVDRDYKVLALNEAEKKEFFQLVGKEIKVGDNLLELLKEHPHSCNQMKGYFERAFHGEKFIVDPYETSPGSYVKRFYDIRITPITDHEGKITGVIQTGRDITNKVKNEKKIQDITRRSAPLIGEEFFKELTEQLAFIFNAQYVYIGLFTEENNKVSSLAFRVNGKLEENFSYDLANTPCAVISQNKKAFYFDQVKSRFPEDDKLKRWNAESYLGIPVIAPSSGELIGILVMINDKSWEQLAYADYVLVLFATRAGAELERIRSEEKIREKDEQLARISGHVPGIIYELRMNPDKSAQFLYVSEGSYNLLELKPEEMLRDINKVYACLYPEDRAHLFTAMEHSALTLEHFHFEGRVRTAKSRKLKWIKADAKPQKSSNGDTIWYGFIDDITQLKEVEFKLIRAKEESEKAAQVKEDFMSTMSHEIRTPLNAIVGITNLLLNKEPKQDQLENLNTLKFSSESLMNLINDVLDFSKLESGKVEIEEVSFDLRALLNCIKQAHLLPAKERNNQLLIEVDEKIPATILGDQVKLAQVMNNLISNAVKFTHDGLVTVKVELKSREADQLWLHFSVRDTGIGIPEDKLRHIFEKFTQADTSTVRRFGGTGLGLTITKMLLNLKGSDIQVDSQEGKGSNFYFDLKLREDTLLAAEKQKADERGEQNQQDILGEIRILMVEDVAINRFVVKQYLQTWGNIQVDEASNGLEAIEKVKANPYDIILMDIRMPEMDGYEAAKVIRSFTDPRLKNIPIIALTADTAKDIKHENALVFTDVVTKPFNPNELYAKVVKYTVGVKSQGNPKTQMPDDPKPKESVSYQKIEASFHHNMRRIISFYQVAEKALLSYKEKYEVALRQKDSAEADQVAHQAKLTLKTLGLDILLARLVEGKNLIDQESSQEVLHAILADVNQQFDQAIDDIKKRLDQVTQHGL